MKLIEFEAKGLLHRHGLTIPRSQLLRREHDDALRAWPSGAAAKAQLLSGGRGLSGLVQVAPSEGVETAVERVRQGLVRDGLAADILVEERIEIALEHYIALRIDDVRQCISLMFALEGGVHVEAHPENIRVLEIDPNAELLSSDFIEFFRAAGVEGRSLGDLSRLARQLLTIFVAEDCELLEVNPLVRTADGKLVILDAKVVVDDAAAFRHRDRVGLRSSTMQTASRTELEKRAAESGFTFVELDGEVAILSGGAGIGMLLFDTIVDHGMRPANFVDVTGGSNRDQWQRLGEFVFDYAERPQITSIIAYFTLSVTPLKSLVDGLVGLLDKRAPPKPMVIGLQATGASVAELSLAEAQHLLRKRGLHCEIELADVVGKLRKLADESAAARP